MKGFLRKRRYFSISCASICVVLPVWFLWCDVSKVTETTVFPGPVKMLTTFIQKLTQHNLDNATLLQHAIISLWTCLLGHGIGTAVGIPMSILMAWNEWCDRSTWPLFNLIRPIPGSAWIPLFIALFDIGIGTRAVVISINPMVACTTNAYTGIWQTRQEHIWLGDVFGASNTQRLFKIAIPSATPMIFTGPCTALGGSWTALVAAELLVSSKDLDFMIQDVRLVSCPNPIIVGVLCIGVVGLVLSATLEAAEKMVAKGTDAK